MSQITEENSEVFSIHGPMLTLSHSIREMAKTRKSWQKRGIVVFESFYYNTVKFTLLFASILLAQASQALYELEDLDGRYANEYVWICLAFNFVLLVDLVLHVVFFGF